jgi:DNA replication and repair protein RecF
MIFQVNGRDISRYGSSGQQRGMAFAMKIAELRLFQEKRSDKPVFMLDDIDTELDMIRIQKVLRLAEASGVQIIATTTKPDFIQTGNIRFNGGKII